MKSKYLRGIVAPVVAAAIWGLAFTAQSIGAGYVGPFTFTAARSAIAVITLSVILAIAMLLRRRRGETAQASGGKWALIVGGV